MLTGQSRLAYSSASFGRFMEIDGGVWSWEWTKIGWRLADSQSSGGAVGTKNAKWDLKKCNAQKITLRRKKAQKCKMFFPATAGLKHLSLLRKSLATARGSEGATSRPTGSTARGGAFQWYV